MLIKIIKKVLVKSLKQEPKRLYSYIRGTVKVNTVVAQLEKDGGELTKDDKDITNTLNDIANTLISPQFLQMNQQVPCQTFWIDYTTDDNFLSEVK